MIFYKIQNPNILNLEKAQNEGRYVDNFKNRKLGIVGQLYNKQQVSKDEKELSNLAYIISQSEKEYKKLDEKAKIKREENNMGEAEKIDSEKLGIEASLNNLKTHYNKLKKKIDEYRKKYPIKVKEDKSKPLTNIKTDTYWEAKLGRHAKPFEFGGKLSSAGKEARILD